MRPHHVGNVPGKKRVVVTGQPLGQHLAAILAFHIRHFSAKKLGRHNLVTHDVPNFPAATVIDDALPVILTALASDLGEEVGKRIIIVCCPPVEGVVVTLGTLHTHPHENLRGIFHELQLIRLDLVKIPGRITESATLGPKQVLHNLINRPVLLKLCPQPLKIQDGVLVLERVVVGTNLQQLSPFHHPHLHEFWPTQ